jgi:hypothetical protein
MLAHRRGVTTKQELHPAIGPRVLPRSSSRGVAGVCSYHAPRCCILDKSSRKNHPLGEEGKNYICQGKERERISNHNTQKCSATDGLPAFASPIASYRDTPPSSFYSLPSDLIYLTQ